MKKTTKKRWQKFKNYIYRISFVMYQHSAALPSCLHFVFTRESSYCFQRVLAIAILSVRLSVCLSVCPSVTRVDQSKTVQARITKSSPLAVWKSLVSGTVKLFNKFEGGHHEDAKWEGVGQNLQFLANKSLYLSNGARLGLGYYLLLIESHTLALDWCRIQWPWMTLNSKIRGFMDFLAISGCDTSLYHSQGGATYGTDVMRSR